MPVTINGTTGISGVDGSAANPAYQGTDTNTGIHFPAADTVAIDTNGTEALRVDSSNRLLIGTSSDSGNAKLVVAGNVTSSTGGGEINLKRSATVANGDGVGGVRWFDNNGEFASIYTYGDAATGASDYPSRLVFSVTADGSSSPTEALRITNDRVVCYNQPEIITKSSIATLTAAELKTGIIRYTGATVNLTVPDGTSLDSSFSGPYVNITFEWSLIVTGTGNVTLSTNTGHTFIGSSVVNTGTSGRFATRRTSANTYITYRLS